MPVPGLERWVVSGSAKMCPGLNRARRPPGWRKLFKSTFLKCVSKYTGHVRDKLYEAASLTNKFWYSHCAWR